MFYLPFWILIAALVVPAIISIRIKGFNFIDFQLIVMIIAVSFFFDMVFCKWLKYYHYVDTSGINAFYSLIFCIVGYPAIGIAFIKFAPSTRKISYIYILACAIALTIIELLVIPFKIVMYHEWNIIPDSPIIYTISFVWVYYYYKFLKKRIPIKK